MTFRRQRHSFLVHLRSSILPSNPANGAAILELPLSLPSELCAAISQPNLPISSNQAASATPYVVMAAGLKTIIALSFVRGHTPASSVAWLEQFTDLKQVLAIGFLLVILSSALWHKYWPLLVVAIYIVAPLPNWICGRCANPDDFMDSSGSSAMDFGRFMTGFLVLTGIGESSVLLPPSPADNVPPAVMPWVSLPFNKDLL